MRITIDGVPLGGVTDIATLKWARLLIGDRMRVAVGGGGATATADMRFIDNERDGWVLQQRWSDGTWVDVPLVTP